MLLLVNPWSGSINRYVGGAVKLVQACLSAILDPNFLGGLQPEAFPLHWFLLEVLWPELSNKEFFFSY